MTRDELIAALEAATGADRKLDAEIIRHHFGYSKDDPLWHGLEYTASLDAALTLVPEGWDEEIKRARHRKGWFASLALNRGPGIGYDGTMHYGDSPVPALALLIAILKARKG